MKHNPLFLDVVGAIGWVRCSCGWEATTSASPHALWLHHFHAVGEG